MFCPQNSRTFPAWRFRKLHAAVGHFLGGDCASACVLTVSLGIITWISARQFHLQSPQNSGSDMIQNSALLCNDLTSSARPDQWSSGPWQASQSGSARSGAWVQEPCYRRNSWPVAYMLAKKNVTGKARKRQTGVVEGDGVRATSAAGAAGFLLVSAGAPVVGNEEENIPRLEAMFRLVWMALGWC
jgi:hypothetical protein